VSCARRAAARKRVLGLTIGIALLAAGCSSAIAGQGSAVRPSDVRSAPEPPAPTPTGSAPTAPTQPPSTPPATTSSASTPRNPPVSRAGEGRRLAGLLEPKPSGAVTWSGSWGHTVNPTLGQFVRREYAPADVTFVEKELKGQGLLAIAHRPWIAGDSNQADIVLLGFRTTSGATSRWLAATESKAGGAGVRRLRIPGAGSAVKAYYTPKLDDQGYVRAIVYAHRGNVVSETFVYTLARLKKADVVTWSDAQLRRLP
jgi:hypothetical protein